MPEIDAVRDTPDRDLLEQAAREAGALALTYFGKEPETWLKNNTSPVSEADLAVDRFLEDALGNARPDYGWLSEESTDQPHRLDKERVFIVDPIDGTRAFLAGGDEWTVAIAVVEGGVPQAAAVFCPVRGEMYTAVSGGGAFLNGQKLQASGRAAINGALLSGPHSISANREVLAAGFVRTGYIRSLAYRFAQVASGAVDVAVARKGPSDWDLAAADLLVQEAGGQIRGLDGAPVVYNKPETRHPALIAAPIPLIGEAARLISRVAGS
ncbi:3'(2'),5'-bisphosphate nucleotidase CysQ [Roseibium sp. RKSG952]|uniref:3'(2'),5'-bisphosphate nucleotidase CysQ n=1 Tax=Roseibium sp. RKSG952 TaxID=2529384 RepID=UPI0012BD2D2E|nr:3'(2'),5'-bisphosphate nucleotidase CysQ [Roseibium sp. RKSG952]MTI00597.1 3'(2'),5'-bisphosphate nucleotidase CysQ [Roseibium sp. RKSG952]